LKLLVKGLTNEVSELLPSEKVSAGGILALTIGGTLFNKLAPMVDRVGLLLGRGVWIMNCNYCGQVMREGSHYWGNYCKTEGCFNSELARLIYGARYKREKASK